MKGEMKFTLEVTRDGYAYFSDVSGCPRCVFVDNEAVYFARYGSLQDPSWLFFVDTVPDEGRDIAEVRSDFQTQPQWITAGGLTNYTELVSEPCKVNLGTYWGVTRDGLEHPDYKRMPGDEVIITRFCPSETEPPVEGLFLKSTSSDGVRVRNWDKGDDGADCP